MGSVTVTLTKEDNTAFDIYTCINSLSAHNVFLLSSSSEVPQVEKMRTLLILKSHLQ